MSPSGLRVTGPSPIPSVNNSVWPSDSDGQKLCRRGVEDRVEEVAAVAGGEIVFTAMDSATLAASATLALCALLALLVWMRGRRAVPLKKEQRRRVQGQQEPAAGPQVIAGARGRRQGARMRRAAATASNDVEQEEEAAAAAAEEREELEQAGVKVPEGKIGKKKLEKLQAKADRKLAREADEREREEAKKKREQREEEESKKKEREEEEEKRQKEAERLAREEKERREHEEYLKMKEAFQVEEEGFDEDGDAGDDQENKLKQFVDYIKSTKVVLLEDLAAHFRLRTQEAIDRVTQLQEDGTLTGVVDDRGKFIYISQEELEDVAKYIRQMGRVSIAELAECSNKLINLAPPEKTKTAVPS